MTLDLGCGKTDAIKLYENEDPYLVASRFSKKHNFNNEITNVIADKII